MKKTTFAVIVGNRGFFPDKLASDGRKRILEVLKNSGHGAVALSTTQTKHGAVETFEDAKKCAALFAEKAAVIDGIIVTLPNFGDEKGVAEAIKRSGLCVPILVHAEPDEPGTMDISHRRDSFCGKISVCNNLRQAGLRYTLTASHTVAVDSEQFGQELDDFAAVCRVVRGLDNVRFGAIGARTGAFNTVRYSEKLLELAGISVETIDLSEILGQVDKLSANDRGVKANLQRIKKYIPTKSVSEEALAKMAAFGYVVDRWVLANELKGTAIQCWTSLQEHFGIVPCTLMSMMSESLVPSACEVDITGLLGMYILQMAGEGPAAILDWNNNYAEDPDKCVLFHCSNLPRSFFIEAAMDYQQIIAGTVGEENTYGTVVGRIKGGPATFCRASTDDAEGLISAYVGQGSFTEDRLKTFGGYGVMQIPNFQALMEYICQMGFEHHVAVSFCSRADAIAQALDNYMGWEVYRHQ